jgi:signal transduction histidine kinase
VRLERKADEHRNGGIEVTVEDDGQLDRIALARTPGMGLLGMRERITALGGQFMLKPRSANGLVVHARIPIAAVA